MVLVTRAPIRWDEGCEENNLPLSVIPHSTSINMTGRPQTLAVVDDHHCWDHRRGTDARTCHAPSGALVTNDDSGTSTNNSVSRMSVNPVSEENGDSTKLFLFPNSDDSRGRNDMNQQQVETLLYRIQLVLGHRQWKYFRQQCDYLCWYWYKSRF